MANDYFLCVPHKPAPVRWDPEGPPKGFSVNEVYFGGVLQAFEQHLGARGLTVYLTWNVDTLPTTGPDVVAVVLGDEWARMPRYADATLATFKCYGARLELQCNPLRHPSVLNGLRTMQYVKSQVHRWPYTRPHLERRLRGGAAPPVFPIPLGYANQDPLPIRPILDRPNDVHFAGSVFHRPAAQLSPRRWLGTPKSRSREEMVAALKTLQARRPDFAVDLRLTEVFAPHAVTRGTSDQNEMMDARQYAQAIMDAKVCLVPRGTSMETFRYFEALRFGCIVICEALPDRWFYNGSPAVQVERWSELPDLLEALLDAPARMEELHAAGLAWWEERCSEDAVGRYMADEVERLLAVSPRSAKLTVEER